VSLRVLVSGMACNDPWQGGATWAVMQYVLGLRSLGHDVWMVEPVGNDVDTRYVSEVMRAFELEDRVAFLLGDSRRSVGVSYEQLRRLDFDAHLNVSGVLTDPGLVERIPVRAYVDVDPAFTQLWHELEGIDVRLDGHTHFVTVGQAVGHAHCAVPTCGVRWLTTLPPVDLTSWPQVEDPGKDYTTVGNWRSYGSITTDNAHFGLRAHSVRPLFELPRRVRPRLAVAFAIEAAETSDLRELRRYGWSLVDPFVAAGTPSRYRSFVQRSRAEISVAKSGYVVSRCGWFSDRSACYLASGRPVVAQDTGLNGALPTGQGFLAFSELDAAVAAIEEVESDYARHAGAARELAVEYLDARHVLTRLLEQLELS
jgi:hypothetical protein